MSDELRQFIKAEMERRGMKQREFAELLGVSHSTVGRYLSGGVKHPDPDFLDALSDRTNTPYAVVFALAHPAKSEKITGYSAEVLLIASRINNLPQTIRDVYLSMLPKQDQILNLGQSNKKNRKMKGR